MSSYEFTNTWFEVNRELWDQLLPMVCPRKILEIGSYEGASACYLIDKFSPDAEIEIHCVDTWEGSVEHQADGMYPVDMNMVEERFNKNMLWATKNAKNRVDLNVYKNRSLDALTALVVSGKSRHFDFIYLDGSHQAPDVLSDAVLSFQLLKVGGYLAFDDYCWAESTLDQVDILRCPKIAIDSFVNIYRRKLDFVEATKNQMFIRKTAD
jgi:predicted O-methyltransferase YrrM